MNVSCCPLALHRLSARLTAQGMFPAGRLFANNYVWALRDFSWVIAELLERAQ